MLFNSLKFRKLGYNTLITNRTIFSSILSADRQGKRMNTENQHPAPEINPGTWVDLLLYIFIGFGLYVGASILVALPFEEITLTVTLLAILTNFLFIGGGAYVLGIRRDKITWASLGIYPPVWKPVYWVWVVVLAFGLMPIRAAIGFLVETLVSGGLDDLQLRADLFDVGLDTWYGALIMLIGVGVLAPIAEEFFFRGLIYDWCRQRWGLWVSALLSSAWFAIGHIDAIGVAVSSFIMGVVLAWAYERTKSLWLTIAIHIITNSTAVILLLLAQFVMEFVEPYGF
jgi:membrane protease YdiL (CAAX protease family)